jgi:hypothetical protein
VDTPRLTGPPALHFLSVLQYVDGLLHAIEQLATSDPAPFAKQRADVTKDEARRLREHTASVRRLLLDALARLGIEPREPTVSARWSIRTSLHVAEITLTDLTAQGIRGYGAIDAAAGRELDRISAELITAVRQAESVLGAGDRMTGGRTG